MCPNKQKYLQKFFKTHLTVIMLKKLERNQKIIIIIIKQKNLKHKTNIKEKVKRKKYINEMERNEIQ